MPTTPAHMPAGALGLQRTASIMCRLQQAVGGGESRLRKLKLGAGGRRGTLHGQHSDWQVVTIQRSAQGRASLPSGSTGETIAAALRSCCNMLSKAPAAATPSCPTTHR